MTEHNDTDTSAYQCRHCDYPLDTQSRECPTCHTEVPDSPAIGVLMMIVGGMASLTVIGAIVGLPFAASGLGKYQLAKAGHVTVPYTEMPRRTYDLFGYSTPHDEEPGVSLRTDDRYIHPRVKPLTTAGRISPTASGVPTAPARWTSTLGGDVEVKYGIQLDHRRGGPSTSVGIGYARPREPTLIHRKSTACTGVRYSVA